MTTQLVLDALEQAVWTRQRDGRSLDSVVAHTDRGSQYVSIRYTERLAEANIAASVGTVGDSYDNALAETINGLYKTELIKPRKPWKHRRRRRIRDRRMGRLVQPPPALRVLRRHPTRRSRGPLLRSNQAQQQLEPSNQ
jgi:transposase InsO family protein